MTAKTKKDELNENELDEVQGGIALLLPAVQAAREAARRSSSIDGDGVADIITAPGAGGGPHVKIFDGSRDS
jgi:bacteriocin-like protein